MEGFGINTNILETNVINLAVVISVLFFLGKDVLSSLLEERKKKIVQSLNDVEIRFQEAQAKCEDAKANLNISKQKATEIESQSRQAADQSRLAAIQRAESEILRIEGSKTSTLSIEKKKLLSEMRVLLTNGAIEKAFQKLKKDRSTANVQKTYIDTLLKEF
uniref:ATP synthase subunit b, chloroplastic n=1 Tax=Microrhizoidea pickettheapsiorum TaxID=2604950 RepID=A0A5B9RKA3_9CHLO|nr:ATP synthase CF0 subunit I [Microrhizoidea pickettheapsiorum]QEG77699.1 ATP synthase CF0 subunit I [Microrhizoidea pickettheapsiorum]